MAAGLRPALLLAAFALLLVTASANRGFLTSRPRPSSSPAPLVFSFGWGPISIHRVEIGRSCEWVCNRWGLTIVQSPAAALCFYTSPATKSAVYGTWTAAGAGNPPAASDECRGALANGTAVSNVREGVSGYSCGCCGVISRRGVAPSCPTNIVEYAASTANCSSSVTWTGTAGGDGTKVCLRATAAGPLMFGSVYNNGTTCNIWDPTPAATWQKVCMKVNKFP